MGGGGSERVARGIRVLGGKMLLLGTTSFYDDAGTFWQGCIYMALEVVEGEATEQHEMKWVKQSSPGRLIPPLETFIARYPRLWLAEQPEIKAMERLQFGRKNCK